MTYAEAEEEMMKGEKMRHETWPPGKFVFFDSDQDGKPDTPLPLDYPNPEEVIESHKAHYSFFKENLVVVGGNRLDANNRPWITQAETLEGEWLKYA